MTDTHSHIYGTEFDEDRTLVIERAQRAGVERILLPNINDRTIAPMLALCQACPGYCYPRLGLHPEDVADDYRQVLDRMEELVILISPSVKWGWMSIGMPVEPDSSWTPLSVR